MINLDRSPPYSNHNIPLDPDNYYRGLEADSFEELWTVDESGDQVMKSHGKGGTDRLSFQKAFPNDLYVNGLVKANTIIEGSDSMPIEQQISQSGYTYVSEFKRKDVESGEIPLRVYQRRLLGAGAIQSVHTWDLVFNSFPD